MGQNDAHEASSNTGLDNMLVFTITRLQSSQSRSPETGCRFTKGQSFLPKNRQLLENTRKAIEANPDSEFRGPYSELLPLDILTTLALLENATKHDLEEIALLMKMEHGNKIVAQTIHSVNPLELEGPLIRR
ncbi:hypothetical protein OESDEN_05125 [Oesophagostomum dentatum]|uniref:Uncharacterized protein n=1 Tax=Oesophagostomum dentatum TaxID=61180 RepID=A0A0B1TCC2_OESDE|nr:hypothetical protein OESDEN_05125 [Oesophagostomum dentatum]